MWLTKENAIADPEEREDTMKPRDMTDTQIREELRKVSIEVQTATGFRKPDLTRRLHRLNKEVFERERKRRNTV